jgi:hypothetical protein
MTDFLAGALQHLRRRATTAKIFLFVFLCLLCIGESFYDCVDNGICVECLESELVCFLCFLLFLLVDMNLVPVLLLFIAGATILFGHRDEGTAGLH